MATRPGPSRWTAALRTPLGLTTALLCLAVLVLALVAPLVWGDAAEATDTDRILAPASAEHWAGTDSLGRDIVARTLVATRLSVLLALAATAIAVLSGLVLGLLPLLLGRRAGRLVSAGIGIAVAFPGLLLALFFAVVFGVGATGAVLAIGFAGAPSFGRLVQTLAAGVAARDYVSAARVAGVGEVRILVRHVLPNIAEPLIVNATIGAGSALLAFAGLSFLGLGVQAPAYDWGRLLYEGIASLYVNPAAALAPGAAVLLAGLALNLLGESLAKAVGSGSPYERLAPTPRARKVVRSRRVLPTEVPDPEQDAVLEVSDLHVTFAGPTGPVPAVRGVGFTVGRGEAVGIVGESGSGKSVTALAVAQLLDEVAGVDADRVTLLGRDVRGSDTSDRRRHLGTSLAMVFQDPMTSFDPTSRIGGQLAEVARQHLGLGRRAALARAVDRLGAVRIDEPARRARQYPHELSGGMRQRAMIAMGLMASPSLVIADEPTTALDVTVQQQVLDLLHEVRKADDVALVLISHDVTVVGEVCERVLVMYAGRVVEDLPARDLHAARHPYTRALVAAVPTMDTDLDEPLVTIPGRPPTPGDLPAGCAFAPRCPLATDRCLAEDPPLVAGPVGRVACWHADEAVELVPVPGPVAVRVEKADAR